MCESASQWGVGMGGGFPLFCLCYAPHFQHLCLHWSSALFTQNWWGWHKHWAHCFWQPRWHKHTPSNTQCALKPTAVTFQMQMEQRLPATAKMSTSFALASLPKKKKKKRSKFLPAKPSCPCRCTKHMRSLYLHCLRTWIPRLFTETQTTLLGDECQAVLCASSRQHTPREHGLICLFLSGNTVKYGV